MTDSMIANGYETISHEVVTAQASYYVDSQNTGATLAEAQAYLASMLERGPNIMHYVSFNSETRETLTLYPIGSSGNGREDTIRVWLKVEPLRARQKIQLIKMIRELNGLGLKEAKDLVEEATVIDLEWMTLGQATLLESALRLAFYVRTDSLSNGRSSGPPEGPLLYAEHC